METTENKLTSFEIAHIVGVRATQLSEGAEPAVDIGNLIDPVEIAKKELNMGKLPFTIIRTLPIGEQIVIRIAK